MLRVLNLILANSKFHTELEVKEDVNGSTSLLILREEKGEKYKGKQKKSEERLGPLIQM